MVGRRPADGGWSCGSSSLAGWKGLGDDDNGEGLAGPSRCGEGPSSSRRNHGQPGRHQIQWPWWPAEPQGQGRASSRERPPDWMWLSCKALRTQGHLPPQAGPPCSEQGERPVPAPPGRWCLGWDRRGRRPGRRAHLEELDADAGEHELQESGDQDDVADGADGHEHTLHHVLQTEGLVSTHPLAVPRCLPAPQRLREAPGEEWLPSFMLTPHLAKGWGGCPGSGSRGPSLPSWVLPSPLSPSALWPC